MCNFMMSSREKSFWFGKYCFFSSWSPSLDVVDGVGISDFYIVTLVFTRVYVAQPHWLCTINKYNLYHTCSHLLLFLPMAMLNSLLHVAHYSLWWVHVKSLFLGVTSPNDVEARRVYDLNNIVFHTCWSSWRCEWGLYFQFLQPPLFL